MRNYYDIDGYILRGRATMNADLAVGGYVYLCAQKPGLAWSCASIAGAPTDAVLPANQKTWESTADIDFSVVVNDLTVLKEKTCLFGDGTRGCWRHEYIDLTRKTTGVISGLNTDPDGTYEVWMFMARPNAKETSGWRINKGEKTKFALIAKQSSLLSQSNSQWSITIANATSIMTSLGLIAACTSTFLF